MPFIFNQILHDGRGGQCEHFTAHQFLDPINSLAAMGKKTKKIAPHLVSKNNTGSAALAPDSLPVIISTELCL